MLNTETKKYAHNSLRITTFSMYKQEQDISWSKRLIDTLKKIKTEFVLLSIEDFFLLNSVNLDEFNRYLGYIKNDKNIATINFEQVDYEQNTPSDKYSGLNKRRNGDKYTLTTQMSLWRRKKLIKYLTPYENAWQFEWFGSHRTLYYPKDEFYILSKSSQKVFDYNATVNGYGVVRGKWTKKTYDLFDEYDIPIDFSIRGYYKYGNADTSIQIPRITMKNKIFKLHYYISDLCKRFFQKVERSYISRLKRIR